MELGFKDNELDALSWPEIYRKEDYYAVMLRRWLDWALPNHSPPTLTSLVAAMHAVGKERLANDLELWGKQLFGMCCAVMRSFELTNGHYISIEFCLGGEGAYYCSGERTPSSQPTANAMLDYTMLYRTARSQEGSLDWIKCT